MAGFRSPIDPPGWTLTTPGPLQLPLGLRYAEVRLPQLRAERAAPGAEVRMPVPGVLRKVPDAGCTFVEVQANPFPLRRIVRELDFGLPTFYLVFDAGSDQVPFSDGDAAEEGEPLATAEGVSILCAAQDRIGRDPLLWSSAILDALPAADRAAWQPFAAAVTALAGGGPGRPILVLNHRGAPLESGRFEIDSGPQTATAELIASDGGDLQRAVARMHAASPGTMPLTSVLPPGGGAARVRPLVQNADVQVARLEDGAHAEGSIEVTPDLRHVTFTNLRTWFSPQRAAGAPDPLSDYTRLNRLTPFVNGRGYYDHLFRRLWDASQAGAGSGLHLVGGWQTFPDDELTVRRAGEPEDLPLTLAEAAKLIGESGGATRFLSPKFIQLDPGSPVEVFELTLFSVIVGGLLRFQNVDFLRTDPSGAIILLALFVLNTIAVTWIIDTDGAAIEPSKDAVEVLGAIVNAESRYGPNPVTIEDNPRSPPLSGAPWDQFFQLIRHFGIYHQKFAVVKAGDSWYGYAGGIDVNPNRLDDIRHIQRGPYHDVHALVEGPAVHDIALSFEQRWSRDGGGTGLAFQLAVPDPVVVSEVEPEGSPPLGNAVVQVARTYHQAADPSRALAFAPQGDDTIAETMMAAIRAADEFIYIEDQYFTPPPEYREALTAKVASGDIHTLLVVLPSTPDQPFGEIVRTGLISDLYEEDNGRGIVRVGYPRRHHTLADNELRAASGRLLLMQDLDATGGIDPTVSLGPRQRLPQPPFWVAIEGELMYVFNESIAPNLDPEGSEVFQVVRGAETRLVRGGPGTPVGTRTRTHKKGAAATVVDLAGIYVHSKMMIVDDVFLGIGSANVNRRGLYHDGEINVFSVSQQLKAAPNNPIAALRRRLWAEMLDLPVATAGPLLDDPRAAARLFDRSPFHGNRFVDLDARPTNLMYDATSGDGLALILFRLALLDEFVILDHAKLFDGVIDPTSGLEDV
jgi:phosphatidylserine/phosphatidylglycerophosphate/cardiolipin synthase-like enzyme